MSARMIRAKSLGVLRVRYRCALLPLRCCRSGGHGARFLSIATGGTGGVYYPYGGGLAKLLNENMPGVRATAEVTAASVDNLKLIRDGKADIAFTLADTLADAVAGARRVRRSAPVPVGASRCSTKLHPDRRAERVGHQTIADLRGKVVSTGRPAAAPESSRCGAESGGLDPARRQRQGLGVSESAER